VATVLGVLLLAGCGGDEGAGDRFTIESRILGKRLEQAVLLPPGEQKGRPLLVLLHGRGMDPGDMATEELERGLKRLGKRAPVVVIADGGDHSYFHDRREGRWGSYVLREVAPEAVRRFETKPGLIAIGGFSMGGFGALDLARTAPGVFCAVGGHAPALWLSGGETPEGAFDDAEDFARHDVLGEARANPELYGTTRVWLDVGTADPFREATTELARRLTGETFHVWPGGHGMTYIRTHAAEYLSFYAQAYDDCR
jgi:S-formylglutathione hydrolase FrmB